MSEKQKGPYTLYQFLLPQGYDYEACRQLIKRHYDGDVVVEVDLDKNMPADILPMIISGTVLSCIILTIMCSSFMEVVLILILMAIAVAINMGSNIFLSGVSFMTNTMSPVLQMILAMDYSIIIINRYRQEKMHYPGDNPKAMEEALRSAAMPVLSSAMTTIMSLLMLMFMRLKIGIDLGLVLSKGVLISMICNFTVLPALIVAFDRAIVKTEKKVPKLPSRSLALFEIRWRYVLAVLFVALFVSASILQKRTPISFSAIFETEIGKHFPPQNPMILLYETDEEDVVPPIFDTLQRDPHVVSCLSYPALVKRGYTISEMMDQAASLSDAVTEDLLKVVYYAYSHPTRNEKLSLNEIQDLADELAEQGLVPEGFDTKSLMSQFQPVAAPAPKEEPAPETPSEEPAALEPADSTSASARDSLETVAPAYDSTAVAMADSSSVKTQEPQMPVFTYEEVTEQLTAKQLASRYGIERSYINTIYRMAGHTRKPATMSPHEVLSFVNNKLLKDKRYSSLASDEQKAQFRDLYHIVDSVFLAGPTPADVLMARSEGEPAPADSTAAVSATDSIAVAGGIADDALIAQVPAAGVQPVEDDDEPELTPLERLAEMSFSGRKYNSKTVCRALRAAGVPVTQDDMDLLYLYAGSRRWDGSDQRMSISQLVNYIDDSLATNPAVAPFLDADSRTKLSEAKEELNTMATTLRTDTRSIAAIITDYEFESPATFSFIDRFQELADRSLYGEHVIIAESAMYKEIKDTFPSELLLLTILTVAAIFIIVAITFRSIATPVMLVLAVMSGVYVNVVACGLGGHPMYFIAYLVVQSILMGATIDYSIIFTTYYRESRMSRKVPGSIMAAYLGAGHSIMTSGLILTLTPFVMSLYVADQIIVNILKCLASGALSALLIIFLVLPGAIAIFDFMVAPKGAVKSFGNK